LNKAELKKYLKEHNLKAKELKKEYHQAWKGYKSKRPVLKIRVKSTTKKVAKGIVSGSKSLGKKTKQAVINKKKNVKDFINTRQKYNELKKKWNYMVSTLTVLNAAGTEKDVRKEINDIVNFIDNEPELAKDNLEHIE